MAGPMYVPDLDVKDDTTKPPVKLMTDFLNAVQDEEYQTAQGLADQILGIEPSNAIVKEYKVALHALKLQTDAEAKLEGGEEKGDSSSDDNDEEAADEGEEDSGDEKRGEGKEASSEEEDAEEAASDDARSKVAVAPLTHEENLARFQAMFDQCEQERIAAAGSSGDSSSAAIRSRDGAKDDKGDDDDDDDEPRHLSETTPETAEPKGPFVTNYAPSDKK